MVNHTDDNARLSIEYCWVCLREYCPKMYSSNIKADLASE